MGGELRIASCRLRATSLKIDVIDTESLWRESVSNWESTDIYFQTPTYLNTLRGDAEYKILYPELTALTANLIATAKHVTGKECPKPEEIANQIHISGIDIKTPKTKPGETTPTEFIGWVKMRPNKNTGEKQRN